jgi:hypothetical protein
MKIFTFGNDPEIARPAPKPIIGETFSKLMTAAVAAGAVIIAIKSSSEPIRGGVEITRVR